MGPWNTQDAQRLAEREKWLRFYNSARVNFLLILVFTVLNIILRLTESGVYFLFSAAMPTYFVDVAMDLGGGKAVLTVALMFAALSLVFYLIAFIFSKKPRLGWMIAGTLVLLLDTLILAVGYVLTSVLIDLFFHIYLFVSQVLGLIAAIHLARLPEEGASMGASVPPVGQTEGVSDIPNSPVLRAADLSARARVLLSAEVNGHGVIYRRVKRTNELVIDGNVYGEYIALAEMPHELSAVIDGHVYAVGLVSGFVGKSYLSVDGNVVLQKTRWI